jgi:pyridoxine 5'-phosphate synthase PdxJ
MNIEKTVRKALFSEPKKVELSSEKVELGLVQDIAKVTASIKAGIAQLQSIEGQAAKAVDNYEAAIDKAYQAGASVYEKLLGVQDKANDSKNKAIDLYTKAEAAAKELGLSVNDITGVKELSAAVDDLTNEDKAADSVLDALFKELRK